MIQVAMTRQQFVAKCAELKASQGVVFTGDSGTISKSGISAHYEFDGSALMVWVQKKPFLVTLQYVENQILAWLAGS